MHLFVSRNGDNVFVGVSDDPISDHVHRNWLDTQIDLASAAYNSQLISSYYNFTGRKNVSPEDAHSYFEREQTARMDDAHNYSQQGDDFLARSLDNAASALDHLVYFSWSAPAITFFSLHDEQAIDLGAKAVLLIAYDCGASGNEVDHVERLLGTPEDEKIEKLVSIGNTLGQSCLSLFKLIVDKHPSLQSILPRIGRYQDFVDILRESEIVVEKFETAVVSSTNYPMARRGTAAIEPWAVNLIRPSTRK